MDFEFASLDDVPAILFILVFVLNVPSKRIEQVLEDKLPAGSVVILSISCDSASDYFAVDLD